MGEGDEGAKGSAELHRNLWGVRAKDWAEVQESTVLPLYQEVLSKTGIGNGTRLLDMGCGAGMFCNLAAERGSRVSGIDAAPALIDIAKSRTPHGRFEVGNMESLPFAEAAFDVVTGFNSIQHVGSPVTALREARRVAARDARFVMAVWGMPQHCQAALYVSALMKLLPPPPPGTPGLFDLSEETALRQLLSEAGLTPTEINSVDCPWKYKDAETALRGLLSAGPAIMAIETFGEARVRDAVLAAIEPFKRDSGDYRLENRFTYVVARA